MALQESSGELRASTSDNAALSCFEEAESAEEAATARAQAERQAREALTFQLRETRAYRRAYTALAIEALLAKETEPGRKVR